jgi:HKD family nuclease
MGSVEKLYDGLKTAFVDGTWNSNLAYRPEFLSNDYENGQKVLDSIEKELLSCEEFFISVASVELGEECECPESRRIFL